MMQLLGLFASSIRPRLLATGGRAALLGGLLLGGPPVLAGGARPGDGAAVLGVLWVLPGLAALLSLLARGRWATLLVLALAALNLVLAFLLCALTGFRPLASVGFGLPVVLSGILAFRCASRLLTGP
ncbi:hypothetical protein LJ737_23020 [Hymenobacter sp. 15J16-1T3B]|uniref:hypothetical protein n=1 Tax=Hymenobacter sp. 15J16-1T3B TaxID=2886941 RepID=UPI001D11203E|nr:hypothetical protein [Hymenobacter sp. 15J16-1T3B]MCC3160126.1 hypothetical protein [Hymenobacter sp. 15J16-1T3B]